MIKREELNILLGRLIGEDLKIRIKSPYVACIIKFKLNQVMFSGGFHRSKVSNTMIENHDVNLQDENLDVAFQLEYKDIESVEKDAMEKSELNITYRDGTKVTIYKAVNF